MYCTNCGLKQSGNFCAGCGTRLSSAEVAVAPLPAWDWRDEVRYAVLLYFPEVRDQLAKVKPGKKKMTGEEWLGLCEQAFKPMMHGVPLKTVAVLGAAINTKLGIKTGKSRSAMLDEPTGQVMVDVLCSLAKQPWPLAEVHQGESGCVFEAALPSDLWSLEGRVVVTVERTGANTRVEAATNIPGQLYDWGKSKRCLDQLFGDLGAPRARA